MNLRPYRAMAFATIVLLTHALTLGAQESRGPTRVWAGFGLGSGAGGEVEEAGVALMMQLALQRRPHQFLLRSVFLVDGGFPDGGDSRVSELAILYGRVRSTGFGHAGVATGLAFGTFDGCPGSDERACHLVGIAIAAEAALTARVLGIGVQGFVNLNPKSIFGGGLIFIPVGWMP